jgi:histidinol dehydrogenase
MMPTIDFATRWAGPIKDLSITDIRALFDRSTSSDAVVRARTAEIIADVQTRRDRALLEMAERYDGARIDALEVPRALRSAALDDLDPPLRAAMERTAANVRRAHAAFLPTAAECETEPGVVVGRRPDALGRVGVYAPGGRATYPSSVLMGAIPARVAGVKEVILCSPANTSGRPSAMVLAAAALADVDRVFAVGGAGAVAAMAYGTESIPRVDRIVGPGNAYVAEAKLQVAGTVAIDSPAGPSELLVVADEVADPHAVAIEMLAQAEHDPRACVVAVAIGKAIAARIVDALAALIDDQPRRDVAAAALTAQGAVLSADSLDEAIEFANAYAPEHLLLALDDAESAFSRTRNAGTVFVGARASVAFGDYMTGANHVLPTGGLARSYSGLSILDFFRWTTYQRVSPDAAASLSRPVALFAEAEGLPSHARAARYAGDNR